MGHDHSHQHGHQHAHDPVHPVDDNGVALPETSNVIKIPFA